MKREAVRTCVQAGVLFALMACAYGFPSYAQETQKSSPPLAAGENKQEAKRISGLAIITRIETTLPSPVFHADGYRIQIASGITPDYFGTLKTGADVAVGVWIRYDGRLDDHGLLVVTKAAFFSAGLRKGMVQMGPRKAIETSPYQKLKTESLIDADGTVVQADPKINLSVSDDPCRWNRLIFDPLVQERVERIGLSVVPAFQQELPSDSPARIPFRFYAINAPYWHELLLCDQGLILIPMELTARVKDDRQLAAVLADGVAEGFIEQFAGLTNSDLMALGVTAALSPLGAGARLGTDAVSSYRSVRENTRVWQARARVALQLLADAGYDPRQAPEVSRLLAHKKLPKDIDSLPYTKEGKYQNALLEQLYPRSPGVAAQPGSR